MRVILLTDLRHAGKRGQEVEVKPGHARNYLIPQRMAVEATEGNRKWFEQQRKKIDAHLAKERDEAAALAAQLAGTRVKIAKRVGETQTLYGSVTATEVAEALEAKGVTVDRRKLDLGGGIKTLGEHTVTIDLHHDVTAEVTVEVVAEE
jgi:large subunit ribosomal protein L9